MKISVVGGGSTYTPELISGVLTIGKDLAVSEIALIDIPESAAKLETIGRFADRMAAAANSPLKITRTFDLEEGLRGATVVINQFRVGGLEARGGDERIPLEFGLIGQETTGIGGMMKALRTFPVLDRIVETIRRVSPEAWLVNFTNPAGLNTEYLHNTLGFHRSIGLCNVPIEFLMRAAELLECERNEIFLKYYGLNHLSWVEKVLHNTVDRTADFWDSFRVKMKNNPDIEYRPGFLEELGLLVNPYLDYYYNTRRMLEREIEDRDGKGTRAQQIQRLEPELLALYDDPGRIEIPEELSQRGGFMYSTVAMELIRDLFTDAGTTHIINTPNGSAVDNLPRDYVLEIPARIAAAGPVPHTLGSASPVAIGLIHTVKQFERLTIRAHVEKDSRYAKHAMLIHPLGPDEAALEDVWTALLEANRPFLPGLER